MAIRFVCPACTAVRDGVDDSLFGKRIKCQECGTPFVMGMENVAANVDDVLRRSHSRSRPDDDLKEKAANRGLLRSGTVRKNRIFHDIAIGGGLAVTLLLIFLIDRLASSSVLDKGDSTVRKVRKSGTLLGDHHIVVHIKALGSEERLEKLKVVRLTARSSFARATNVNDITLMWCWEPKITIRIAETFSDATMRQISNRIDQGGDKAREKLLRDTKANLDLGGELALQFDHEARRLIALRHYRPFRDNVIILENKEAFRVFNERLSLPLKATPATHTRNLCFAWSVSNLIPIRRHNFQVSPGAQEAVKGRKCDQFTIHDPDGLQLQFFFDQETHLLAKIAHMGHDPFALPGSNKEVFWEHYFSEYRETEGIKQWRKAETDNDGRRFATLDVTGVEFFDEMRPEFTRPPQIPPFPNQTQPKTKPKDNPGDWWTEKNDTRHKR
jgi:hypothetical protein